MSNRISPNVHEQRSLILDLCLLPLYEPRRLLQYECGINGISQPVLRLCHGFLADPSTAEQTVIGTHEPETLFDMLANQYEPGDAVGTCEDAHCCRWCGRNGG